MMQWVFGAGGSYIFYQMVPNLEDAFENLLPEIEDLAAGFAESTITYGDMVDDGDDEDGGDEEVRFPDRALETKLRLPLRWSGPSPILVIPPDRQPIRVGGD